MGVKAGKPFFVWMNTTRMHLFTHVRESMRGQSGMPGNEYADGMIEHDMDVGKLLDSLDDLGIADDTIVVYSTERADVVSMQYDKWRVENAYLIGWLNLKAGAFLETFADYPPSQPPSSFTINYFEQDVAHKIEAAAEVTAPAGPGKGNGNGNGNGKPAKHTNPR